MEIQRAARDSERVRAGWVSDADIRDLVARCPAPAVPDDTAPLEIEAAA